METKKLITGLNKLFSYKSDDNEEIPQEDLKGYIDCSNVVMVIPKFKALKNYLVENFEVSESKIPELTYNNGGNSTSKFSSDYLKLILEIVKHTEHESFKLSVAEDYPLKLETKEYIVIIAPRVSND